MRQQQGAPSALPVSDQQHSKKADDVVAIEEPGQMLDVRIPHVHAPHGEVGGWRGFVTHIVIVAIGLFLALGMEQGVEAIHHEFQRSNLESQMRETFQANIGWIDSNIRVLDSDRAYLIELRNAVNSRIAAGHDPAPKDSDPRNTVFAPPPNLGSYEASKINGSVGLLGLNRARMYARIEFQQNLMLNSFQHFFDTIAELRAFADRNTKTDENGRGKIIQPNIDGLSAPQLLEYQLLLTKFIQYNRQYATQLVNLKRSYQLMLDGVDDVNILLDVPRSQTQTSRTVQ
jgi:hypothetical protein